MKDLEIVQTGSINDRFHKKIGDIGLLDFRSFSYAIYLHHSLAWIAVISRWE
jgi:hypothetical protein